jgi:hypothetical protein
MGAVARQALIIELYDLGEHAEAAGIDALDLLLALQDGLTKAIEGTGVGEVDGHEIALDDSEASLWIYGPDTKAMLAAVLPVLRQSELVHGGRAILRYDERAEVAAEESFLLADLCARRNG